MRLALRFDMRAPDIGAPPSVLYPASVDMCEWADRLGFETVYLAEHHGAEDGYCPAPMIQASAILARTTRDARPLLGADRRAPRPAAAGRGPRRARPDQRGPDRDDARHRLPPARVRDVRHREVASGCRSSRRSSTPSTQAWTGEPFEFRGRTVLVRPTPVQKPRPPIYIGGSAEASAYRAARLGDGYFPAAPGLFEIYQEELRRLGQAGARGRPRRAGRCSCSSATTPSGTGRSSRRTSSTRRARTSSGPRSEASARPRTRRCRRSRTSRRATSSPSSRPDECVELATSLPPDAELTFQPLMGALDPEVGWRSLELFEQAVAPAPRRGRAAPAPPGRPDGRGQLERRLDDADRGVGTERLEGGLRGAAHVLAPVRRRARRRRARSSRSAWRGRPGRARRSRRRGRSPRTWPGCGTRRSRGGSGRSA